MTSPATIRDRIERLRDQRYAYVLKIREEKAALETVTDRLAAVNEALGVAQAVAQTVQQSVHANIARVVTRCIEWFDEPYEFDIKFERKRGKTEARFVFMKDGHEITPGKGTGGGVMDVAAFALRLACLKLVRPTLRPLVVLDEPFKWVHGAAYRRRVRMMLHELAESLGVQFIIITGIDEFKTGKIVEVG